MNHSSSPSTRPLLRAAVIGFPIGHSLSPAMHNAAFQEYGIDAGYEALPVRPEELPGFVEQIRQPEWFGINVTVPHKVAAAKLVDWLAPESIVAGAVNTIARRGQRLEGFNTDIAGFLRALQEDAGFDPAGLETVVAGAGGAGRACVAALLRAGVARISLINRDQQRAGQLVKDIASERLFQVEGEQARERCRNAALFVNATSAGMSGGPAPDALPVPKEWLPRAGLVYDLVYRPTATPLLRAAQSCGLPVLGGLAMLVYQGAVAFELWTGRPAPVETMRAAAIAVLGGSSACSVS